MMRPAARTARHSSETPLSAAKAVWQKPVCFVTPPFYIRFPHETPKASPKGGFLEVFGVVEKDL